MLEIVNREHLKDSTRVTTKPSGARSAASTAWGAASAAGSDQQPTENTAVEGAAHFPKPLSKSGCFTGAVEEASVLLQHFTHRYRVTLVLVSAFILFIFRDSHFQPIVPATGDFGDIDSHP